MIRHQATDETPAAWSAAGLPAGFPIPQRQWEPIGMRTFYFSRLVPKTTSYRDRCSGLAAEILERDPGNNSLEIDTATKDVSVGFGSLWGAPVDSWCRGDIEIKVAPGAESSQALVDFKSTFDVEPSDTERFVEIGYSTEIDASYSAVGGGASKGRAGVVVRAGLEGMKLSSIEEQQNPFGVGILQAYDSHQLDLDGEAIVRVPASTTDTTVCLSITVNQETLGPVDAFLTSKPRAGVVVFRSISTVTYELEVSKESLPWPPLAVPPWPAPPFP